MNIKMKPVLLAQALVYVLAQLVLISYFFILKYDAINNCYHVKKSQPESSGKRSDPCCEAEPFVSTISFITIARDICT